jgi:hypothetical protein
MAEKPKDEGKPDSPDEETPENEEKPEKESPKPEPEKEEEEEAGEEAEPEKEKPDKEKSEGETPEEEEEPEDKSKRTPRLMEVYKHKIAEKNWGKEREKLEGTVADLTEQLKRKSSPERDKAIKSLIEKSGMEPEVVEELVKLAEMGQVALKKELESLRTEIKSGKEKALWAEEDSKFEQDFEKNIAPILKTDNVPAENIPRLKKLLKTLAFTEEYAKSPLPVVYRGVEDFQQFLPGAKKKSGEETRGGIRGKEGEKSILDMDNKEFEEYMTQLKKEEGGFDLRRDGRPVSG